ncbi:MAG: transglycosylase SLT domain-containing protein [Bacteroidota bacterium]
MKKTLLLLCFLLLTKVTFAQKSQDVNFDEGKTFPLLEKLKDFDITNPKLSVIDRNYDNTNLKQTGNTFLFNDIYKINIDENDFSSFVLIEQLNKLDHKTPFNLSHNPTLERYIRVFLKDRRESLANLLDRAKYYFPLFEKHLDKYDLPLEIKYLAVVESALKPKSTSSAGAKGLWQFMYSTGKMYGLEVNSYVDERYDPIKSTEAACKYIERLYNTFHDWDLALAAYNSGPGNVSKAIRRSGGKRNYWEIRQYLPQETRGYLPAFYATYYIFEYAKFHKIYPKNNGLTYMEIDTVHIKKQISFTDISKHLQVENSLLVQLNPQYKREVIPYSSSDKQALTLPKGLIDSFIEKENEIYKPEKVISSKTIPVHPKNSYEVKQGDNLFRIAQKFNISLAQLKTWNGLQTEYLIKGQRLVITDKKFDKNIQIKEENTPQKEVKKSITASNKEFKTYKVKQGDSLFKISRYFPYVTINQLRKWNNIWGKSYLKPGTILKIYKS